MLSVTGLEVYYDESKILSDVSMEVPTGKIVCLLGRNGVGKTTFMKSVMGLVKARNGEIHLDGEDLTGKPTSSRARAGIGYVPQGRGIFPHLSVYENLLMGFEASPKRKVDKNAIEKMYTLFPVLQEMRKRVAGTLSGGQQQQLAIARTLVRDPSLLLLDEPTEGIQPSIMLEIEEVILRLREELGMTILVVEQFLDFALSVADLFYIMETGSIVEQGDIEEFSDDIAKTYLAV